MAIRCIKCVNKILFDDFKNLLNIQNADFVTKTGKKLAPALARYQYFGFRQKCRTTPKISLNINACIQNFTKGNELIMKQLVANVGPIASVVDVTLQFILYKSGIYSDTKFDCNCNRVNHATIIVLIQKQESITG